MTLPNTILLIACHTSPTTDPPVPDDDTAGLDTATASYAECMADAAPLPAPFDHTRGFATSEDFAFDAEGWVVNVDYRGHLVRQSPNKTDVEVIRSDVGAAAGTRFLADGSIVLCNVERGTVERTWMDGSWETVAAGLQYPNGLDVGLDGKIYVSEQTAGRVRQVDPESGDYAIIATGLFQPNGITFSPDHDTMYVGSFGAGIVYAVDRDGADAWSPPRELGKTPGAPEFEDDCLTRLSGDDCYLPGGTGVGTCTDASGALTCELVLDTLACDGRVENDNCATTLLGAPIDGRCRIDSVTRASFCPRVGGDRLDACITSTVGATCEIWESGSCALTWEGALACVTSTELNGAYTLGCVDKPEGEACTIDYPASPDHGTCVDWGYSELYCTPEWWLSGWSGGLDGIGADACGNVYVTEYIAGLLYRFPPEGGEPELAADLESEWIPNLHWGHGIGGWERNVAYVMDLGTRGIFSVELGLEGHPEAYDPGSP